MLDVLQLIPIPIQRHLNVTQQAQMRLEFSF